MQSPKRCFSPPGKPAEAGTHWAQCERAEQPPPARKGECCSRPVLIRALFPGGCIAGRVDGQIADTYRWCLPSYWDKTWSTGLCKNPSLWQHKEICQEPQAGKVMPCPCFYTEQPFDFSLQLSSATPHAVCFDGAAGFLPIYSCWKVATWAGIACSLERLRVLFGWLRPLNQVKSFVFRFSFSLLPSGAFHARHNF